jgi:uncharacterized LabA/DUF88 family protein
MKIGLDIASMSYKKQVNKIILISGESDFVPAAKLARREGIEFILDSMNTTRNSYLVVSLFCFGLCMEVIILTY